MTTTVTVSDPVTGTSGPSPEESSLTTPTPEIRRGDAARFDLFVGDAAAHPLEGIRVAFASDKAGTFEPREATTSSLGMATTMYRPDANGAHLVRALSAGVTLATATLSVTGSSK